MGRQAFERVRISWAGAVALGALVMIVSSSAPLRGVAQVPGAQAASVDPLWPQPLPNHWILGSVTGVDIDSRDHVWVVHQGAASLNRRTENALDTDPPGSEYCCASAPQVLEFDADGQLVGHWGGAGEGFDWPANPGGMAVDDEGNVWIAAAGLPPAPAGRGGRGGRGGAAQTTAPPVDGHILKFSADGTFLMQIGHPGEAGGPDALGALLRPAAVDVDTRTNEVFVADTGHQRVAVFDATTGAYKRQWGNAGTTPFQTLSCITLSRSGEVFVCDQEANTVFVFKTDGTPVREAIVSPGTRGAGSLWDIALSADSDQKFAYVANGQEQTVHVLERATLSEVGRIGSGGRWPGYFFGVGSVAVNSMGQVITGEALQGKRVQRFLVNQAGR